MTLRPLRFLTRVLTQKALLRWAWTVWLVVAAYPAQLDAGEWRWTRWKVGCLDPPDCRPANEVYAEQLEKASVWLDGLGFGPPRVTEHKSVWDEEGNPLPDGLMYWYADVSNKETSEKDPKTHKVEEYLGLYSDEDKTLYLRSDVFFAMGEPGQTEDDPWYGLEESKTFTPIHELFHAVEAGYHDISDNERDWIWEGSADAVLRAFADQFESELGVALSARVTWDRPLHKPPDGSEAYGTWFFWRDIGLQIGSQSTIQYLRDVLAENLDKNRGLNGVDRVLKPHGGLYNQLPKFFSGLDIQKEYFGLVDRIEAVLPNGQTRHQESFGSAVNEVAGNPHELTVKANTEGGGKPVEVEISFKQNHDNLHLIVDGSRFDQEGTNRNLYRDLLVHQNQKKFDIIVANVEKNLAGADDHSGKTRQQSYELEVSLRQVGYCSMTARVSGDISSSHFGDIAHFSTTGGATGYGVASNPEMIEGMLDWAADMADASGGEGAGEEFEAQTQQSAAESGTLPRETFGLSLIDQKLDAEGKEAFAFIAGGFSLEASVIGTELPEKFTGGLPLKILRVVPGARAESTLDKVPFVWVEGAPGSAQLYLTRNTGDLVAGRIAGTLYAEGYYKPDGSRPVIHVQASFVALPGPLGCLPGGLGMY